METAGLIYNTVKAALGIGLAVFIVAITVIGMGKVEDKKKEDRLFRAYKVISLVVYIALMVGILLVWIVLIKKVV